MGVILPGVEPDGIFPQFFRGIGTGRDKFLWEWDGRGLGIHSRVTLYFDCAKFYIMFNMNFRNLVLCEIIVRNERNSIIVVVQFFIVGLSYRITVLNIMMCAWTSVKYLYLRCLFWSLILGTSLHLNSDCWHWKWCMCFSMVSFNFLIAILTVSAYFIIFGSSL